MKIVGFGGGHIIIYFERIIFLCQNKPFMWKGYTWPLRESLGKSLRKIYEFMVLQLYKSRFDLSTNFNH